MNRQLLKHNETLQERNYRLEERDLVKDAQISKIQEQYSEILVELRNISRNQQTYLTTNPTPHRQPQFSYDQRDNMETGKDLADRIEGRFDNIKF